MTKYKFWVHLTCRQPFCLKLETTSMGLPRDKWPDTATAEWNGVFASNVWKLVAAKVYACRGRQGWRRKKEERRRGHGAAEGSAHSTQQWLHKHWEPLHSAYGYSPSGVKPRAGLVSRLLSRLVSRLHPWLMLGRGIRLLRASVQHEGFQRRWTNLMKTENLTSISHICLNVIMTLSLRGSMGALPMKRSYWQEGLSLRRLQV